CVHCGLCLASCPTYVELGEEADSPRGRIYLMRALEEGRLEPTAAVVQHLDRCLGCRACETACPSGVEYGRLIEAARPFVESHRRAPARLARAALAAVLTSPVLGPLAMAPLRLAGGRRALGRLARRAPSWVRPWLSLAAAAPGPSRGKAASVVEPEGECRGTAILLEGCAPSRLFAETTRATAALLARAGVRVVVPPARTCCGALALHLGQLGRARRLARETLRVLGDADWIVSGAAGCGALLREYDHLLPDDAAVASVARRARDPLALLHEIGLPPPRRSVDRRVAVHDPCHLAHGQGVRAEVRRLLAGVPGLSLVDLDEADFCCGSAGTYNLTEPALAARLLARKLDRIEASGADVIAAANPGCLLQIRGGAIARGLDVAIEHPIDLLAAAYV
ncbi:MAG TPA: heterodisulfide reductase-related iron-sulfur binding cluster, partial [Myxococcota bacterium]|nr:heterodisulfide reductase-related iron-sulfur binding cluster [Myxococcota bacterium]